MHHYQQLILLRACLVSSAWRGYWCFYLRLFPSGYGRQISRARQFLSIPIAAVTGVPMYIRAETIIPISAALVGKGMGVGTVLSLIIGGAGASIPELIILNSMFKKKLIFAFVLTVFVIAVIAGYLVDILQY